CTASLSAPRDAPMTGNAGKIASIENGPNMDRPASSSASRPVDLGRCGDMGGHRRPGPAREGRDRQGYRPLPRVGAGLSSAPKVSPAGEGRPGRTGTAAEGATPVIAQAHVPPAGTTLERPVKPGAEGAWGKARARP